MKRRTFSRLAMLGSAVGISSCVTKRGIEMATLSTQIVIKPKRLKRGDTIGLIAPASPFSDEAYKKAVKQIQAFGYSLKYGKNLFKKYGYVAGKDTDRIADIHQMFADPEVDGIWCLRGGYGTTRLLPDLDYNLIRNNPKALIGYSDITALINAIYQKTGLVGFHGPVASSTMTEYTGKYIGLVSQEPQKTYVIDMFRPENEVEAPVAEVIIPGKASGRLVGGNLSLLAAMSGTGFQLDATDKLLFIEDVGEKPYRIDRMLTQLLQSSNLHRARGIILGVFADCEADEGDFSLTLRETIIDRLKPLGIPLFYGFSFGHISDMCTLPIGINASFDTTKKQLVILESAVS